MTDEQRQARLRHHMYETCEGIAEHAERIVALEELCEDIWAFASTSCKRCEEWVQLSVSVGTCRLSECKVRRDLAERMSEWEVLG